MKKVELLKTIVILPVIIGIVLGIGFFAYVNSNQTELLPLANNIEFAYYDNLDEVDGKLAGELNYGDSTIQIEYGNSYSSIGDKLCICDGSNAFGEIGTVYLKTSARVSSMMPTHFEINSNGGAHNYKLMYELDGMSEYELLHYSTGASKGLVVYWQDSNSAGLKSTFCATVFEEVE